MGLSLGKLRVHANKSLRPKPQMRLGQQVIAQHLLSKTTTDTLPGHDPTTQEKKPPNIVPQNGEEIKDYVIFANLIPLKRRILKL